MHKYKVTNVQEFESVRSALQSSGYSWVAAKLMTSPLSGLPVTARFYPYVYANSEAQTYLYGTDEMEFDKWAAEEIDPKTMRPIVTSPKVTEESVQMRLDRIIAQLMMLKQDNDVQEDDAVCLGKALEMCTIVHMNLKQRNKSKHYVATLSDIVEKLQNGSIAHGEADLLMHDMMKK